jgi:hypothetical protein
VVSTTEIVEGRVLLVKADVIFYIYAPHEGTERIAVFGQIKETLV